MASKVRAYKHVKQPTDDNSMRQWLETELTNIQHTLNDIIAALKAAGIVV